MGKLSTLPPKRPTSVVKASPVANTRTGNGDPAFAYEGKSALYLLAVTNMVGEDTFYERAQKRDDRFVGLVRGAALDDADWLLGLVGWLRRDANLRTASIVAAVEAADVLAGTEYPRRFIAASLDRADEPGEVIGYWIATRGRKVPSWLKRALADAADRLYNEFSSLKYDGQGQTVRFADVIEFTDPRHLPHSDSRDALWKWLLDRRHGRADDYEAGLPMVEARARLTRSTAGYEDKIKWLAEYPEPAAEQFKAAGMTWESVATWLNGPWTAKAWEAVIPQMGYMALLRNLRNFDEAGVARSVLDGIASRLADPAQVAKSRQLPLRFLSAYNAVTNDRWKPVLGDALDASIANIPALPGDSNILIDTSGSMRDPFSKDGSLKRWDAAAMFGIAFALRNGINEVASFSTHVTYMPTPKGSSLLNLLDRFRHEHFHNEGTQTAGALRTVTARRGRHRTLVLTDEQAGTWGGLAVPILPQALQDATGPRDYAYTFNLAGYRAGQAPAGTDRFVTIGGLTDAAFKVMAAIESGREGSWPWS